MGLFDQWGYTNFHELNLEWILRRMRDLTTLVENFVALNTIKYADPIQWNITSQYETNTIVVDPQTGTAYISTRPVPAGVGLTNTDYWSVIFTLDIISANKNITLRDDGSNVLATFGSVAGEWLLWNGTLYRVSQAINVNEAYVVGYNLDRYTVEMFISDYISELKTDIGDLTDLDTTDKTNLVAAINEVLQTLSDTAGDLTDLDTTDKTNLVAAINEIVANIGDLTSLTTTDQSSIVNAANEINSNVTDLTTRLNNFKFINVLDYELDPTGATDNTSKLQAIINNANAGSVLYFPRGSYRMDSGVIIDKRISFMGDGRTESLLISHYNAGAVITFNTAANRIDGVTIRNIGFAWYSSSISNTGSVAISVEGNSNGVVTYFNHGLFDSIWSEGIETFFQCTKFSGYEEIGFNFNTFTNIATTNRGVNTTKFCLRFLTGSGTGNMIYGCDLAASGVCIDYTSQPGDVRTNIGDIIISNIHFAGDNVTSVGISVYGVNARYHNQLVITNCQFDAGIVTAFTINTMDTVTIHDCNLSSQWNHSLMNCTNCSIDFGQNTQSTFYLFDTRLGKTSSNFGYALAVGACPIHYKIFAHGTVSGVGTRCGYIEGIYDGATGNHVINNTVPDTTYFDVTATPLTAGGNSSVTFAIDYNRSNDYPVYATIEIDCKKFSSYFNSAAD